MYRVKYILMINIIFRGFSASLVEARTSVIIIIRHSNNLSFRRTTCYQRWAKIRVRFHFFFSNGPVYIISAEIKLNATNLSYKQLVFELGFICNRKENYKKKTQIKKQKLEKISRGKEKFRYCKSHVDNGVGSINGLFVFKIKRSYYKRVVFTLTIPSSSMTLAAKMNKLVPITAEYAIWTPVI